jgi:prevent-host-death family protein
MAKAKPKPLVPKFRRARASANDLRTMTAASARSQFSEIVNRTAFGGERVVVTRRGKALAALVSIGDLALLEELENRTDARDFRVALKAARRETTVAWGQLKRQLGL